MLVGVNKGLEAGDCLFRKSLNVLVGLMWHSGMSICRETRVYNSMGMHMFRAEHKIFLIVLQMFLKSYIV